MRGTAPRRVGAYTPEGAREAELFQESAPRNHDLACCAAADDSTAALRVSDPGGGGALPGPGEDVRLRLQLEGGAEARSVTRPSRVHW